MSDRVEQAKLIIAVDGPAASGKGTLSKLIAAHYGLRYLDTGSLYRAVGLLALDNNIALDDGEALEKIAANIDGAILDDPRLRAPGVGERASKVARLNRVRERLLSFQRRFAAEPPGAVLDGRDIGTVVCPDADVKLFVTASIEVRAARRYKEIRLKNCQLTLDDTRQEITRRDERDGRRKAAPLSRADDAHLLDTTKLDIEAAMDAAVHLIDQAVLAKRSTL